MISIENYLGKILSEDIGKLILRVGLGFLMIFHGYKKAVFGVGGIKAMLASSGFPEFLAYGVYMGELVVPILLVLGIYTRISSLVFASTMAFAIYLTHSSNLFLINEKTGGLSIELPLLFMLSAITLLFIGAGKYSFDRK